MNNKLLISLLILQCLSAGAQDSSSYKTGHIFDLSGSVGKGDGLVALQWSHLHGFGKGKQRFKAGYGIRFTSYIGADKLFTTAPSKYTSTKQSLATIFSETILDNIDTFSVNKTAQTNSINISVHFQYAFGKKQNVELGCNIDGIGYSFGAEKKGTIVSSELDESSAPVQYAKPTQFNLLLTSDNDIGSLNSEFYLRYWFTKKLGVKAGYTFYFSEYQTYNKVSFDDGRIQNDRYRYKSKMVLLGVCWRPFRRS